MKFILDTANENKFDYSKEMSSEESRKEYSLKLMKIFTSNGNDSAQNVMWAQHILDTYNQSIIEHNVELLASDKTFLCDFTDNADEHRKLVCRYCGNITSSLKYFNI